MESESIVFAVMWLGAWYLPLVQNACFHFTQMLFSSRGVNSSVGRFCAYDVSNN